MTRATSSIMWTLRAPVASAEHRFVVNLVTGSGDSYSYAWSLTRSSD